MPKQRQIVQPSFKYSDDTPFPGVLGARSRNISLQDGLPRTRPGYSIYNEIVKEDATKYTEYIPLSDTAGSPVYAIVKGNEIFDSAGTLLATMTQNPYNSGIPLSVIRDNNTTIVGDGANYYTLGVSGGLAVVKDAMVEPSPCASAVIAGGALTSQLWFIRIRWYDSDTGTYSGPNEMQGITSIQQTTTAGNQTITLDITALVPPTRATHWEIQMASIDTPSDYEVILAAGEVSTRIPVATLTATLDADPAAGFNFQFRTNGAVTQYRYGYPPVGYTFAEMWRGRMFASAYDGTWLAWSEADNIEHWYGDATDPPSGVFNVTNGEGTITDNTGPCTGLAATEQNLLFFMAGAICIAEGTWEERFNNAGTFIGRQARLSGLSMGNTGNVAPRPCTVDTEIYFAAQDGPKVFSNNRIVDLSSANISTDWQAVMETATMPYIHIGYSPDTRQVLYLVSMAGEYTSTPTRVFAYQRDQGAWCPPWDLAATSLTLHRLQGSVPRGNTLLFGTVTGQIMQFNNGTADGDEDTNAGFTPYTPDTALAATSQKIGAGWTVNEFMGMSAVLEYTNGDYERVIINSNTTDTLSWVGGVTVGYTTVHIGGIAARLVLQDTVEFQESVIRGFTAVIDDLPERLA
jgi:hypothetical protein